MKVENIPAEIKSKSLKEAKDEINEILTKLESKDFDLSKAENMYKKLIYLNKHIENLFKIFDMSESEAKSLVEKKIPLPAYDQCLKASHIFNVLDARGAISVAQRAEYIGRIREITKSVASIWIDTQI